MKIDLIPTNPADKVERPKKNEFKGSYYSADEIHALMEIAEGTKLEIPVLLASFYGLRRSEVLGLKWDAIDFEANTLEVKHIVTQASIDGKKVLAGSYWKPKKDPYSIPNNSQFVKIMKRYGFYRGAWGKRKDYMHFSYFGT